jgi:hypothetical protein
MFTAKEEYKSHGPHTDYEYNLLVSGEPGNKGHYYAWIALVPTTETGIWLHIWFDIGYGYSHSTWFWDHV